MGRGREKLVSCDSCGRQVRRDKAVTLDKMLFSNPMEKKETVDEQYSRGTFGRLTYCPSCGKHKRIYEKKKQMLERQKERQESGYRFDPRDKQY
jgi:ribosomal protein S26